MCSGTQFTREDGCSPAPKVPSHIGSMGIAAQVFSQSNLPSVYVVCMRAKGACDPVLCIVGGLHAKGYCDAVLRKQTVELAMPAPTNSPIFSLEADF